MAKTKRKKRVVKKSQIKSKPKSSSSSSKSSSSSSSSSKSSSSGKYETTDGKKFSDKADASAHQKKLNSSGKGVGTKYDKTTGRGESTYRADKKNDEEVDDSEKSVYEKADDTALRNTAEFKALGKDDQEAVLAVFNAIASNDAAQANRLAGAFKAATKLNDPYFNEQLRLAMDAIERGYVAIDEEEEYKEMQLKRRRDDVRRDYEKRREYLTLEQASDLRSIEREYTTQLDDTRQNLAASGKISSSQRVQKESMLEETFGDLRSSTNRKFAFEMDSEATNADRVDRDVQSELARLAEITKAGKLDFLRKAEEQVGSKNLPSLDLNYKPLGNVYGEIPRNKIDDTLKAATSFVF